MNLLLIVAVHLLAIALQIGATLQAARKGRLYAFLFVGLVAIHVLMLPSLGAFVSEFGLRVVVRGEFIALIGTALLALSVEVAERVFGVSVGHRGLAPFTRPDGEDYVLAVAFATAVMVAVLVGRGFTTLANTWEQAREVAGPTDAIANLLQFIVFPSGWIAYRKGHRAASVVLFAIALVTFPALGSRAALLTIPIAVGVDMYVSGASRKRARVVMFGAASTALFAHVLGRFIRGLGLVGTYRLLTGGLLSRKEFSDLLASTDWTGGESGIGGYFFFVVREGSFQAAAPLASAIRWLTMYLPRSMFEGIKPEDVTYVLWREALNRGVFDADPSLQWFIELLTGGVGGSIHPTLWGEMWVNGGLPALVVCSLLLALWLVALDRIVRVLPPVAAVMVMPAVAVGYLMVARGNSVIGLGYAAYLVPCVVGLTFAASVSRHTLDRLRLRMAMVNRSSG